MYTKHTFCFADYYDVDRIHFGALRVINDITIAPGKGLTDHPHTDMELVLLGMRGELVHRDSLGTKTVLHEGSVQAISAGTYYTHAETNKSLEESVRILQFWIFPRARGLQSRYSHRQYAFPQGADWLLPLISPDEADGTIAIQQDAWLYLLGMSEGMAWLMPSATLTTGSICTYYREKLKPKGNGWKRKTASAFGTQPPSTSRPCGRHKSYSWKCR